MVKFENNIKILLFSKYMPLSYNLKSIRKKPWVPETRATNAPSRAILPGNAQSPEVGMAVRASAGPGTNVTNARRLDILPVTARRKAFDVTVATAKVTLLKIAFRALVCRPATIVEKPAILRENALKVLLEAIVTKPAITVRSQVIFPEIVQKIPSFAICVTSQGIWGKTARKTTTRTKRTEAIFIFVVF